MKYWQTPTYPVCCQFFNQTVTGNKGTGVAQQKKTGGKDFLPVNQSFFENMYAEEGG